MKLKATIILLHIIVVALFFKPAMGQGNIQNTTAGAKIQQSIGLSEVQPMHFGTITVQAGQGGTCVITTAGQRLRTGGVTLTNLQPYMSLATYTVTGEPGRTYSITLPSSATVNSATYSMNVNNFLAKSSSGVASFNATGTLGTGGSEQFTIGATLNVAAGQAEGLYTGTFAVTVAYN